MRTLFIVVAMIGLAITGEILTRRRMRAYWSRKCAGSLWKKRFPKTPKSEIREFLRLFVESFGFSYSRCLCFTPDDRLMDVYRTLYPPKWSPLVHCTELEDFVASYQNRYGIDLLPTWRDDLTFGQVFALRKRN